MIDELLYALMRVLASVFLGFLDVVTYSVSNSQVGQTRRPQLLHGIDHPFAPRSLSQLTNIRSPSLV